VLTRELASRETKRVLDRLHARVLAGDDEALNEFCRRVFTQARGQLVAKTPQEDRDLIETAVDNALLRYVLQPGRYDPSRGHPIPFFKKIAMDSLIDMRRLRRRRSVHEVTVGLDFPGVSGKADPALPDGERQIHLAEQRHLLMSAARSDQERAFVTAWREGSTTAELAQILSLHHSSNIEPRVGVHAMKARLRKRARSAAAWRRA
jgi:DNA-directed RNA polymerase specialized sigma24 family protein